MTGNDDWPSEPRSPQRWQEYAQTSQPPHTLGERLARVEEGLRHTVEKARSSSERLHLVGNRFTTVESRLTILETEQRRSAETVLKMEPLAQEYQRRRDRIRLVKDLLNWLTVPAVFYLAISGRANWAEALGALAKIFGAG